MMKRDEILNLLASHREDIGKFGVKSLALFGSAARDEAKAESDIDILVEFSKPVGLFTFVRLQMHLERLLGLPVDLVTPDALKMALKKRILEEAIHAV